MSDNKFEHDFNWVTARQSCTLQTEFERMRMDCHEAIRQRNLQFEDFNTQHGRSMFGIDHVKERSVFIVLRNDDSVRETHFVLKNGEIVIVPKPEKKMVVTLSLTENGECRYKIDGEGEYLRWQVIRRALEETLFGGINR